MYPAQLTVREGREATFECRARAADNSVYPEVRWTREGGPLPAEARESGGRLTFPQTQLAHSGRYICLASHGGRTVEAHGHLHILSCALPPSPSTQIIPQIGRWPPGAAGRDGRRGLYGR